MGGETVKVSDNCVGRGARAPTTMSEQQAAACAQQFVERVRWDYVPGAEQATRERALQLLGKLDGASDDVAYMVAMPDIEYDSKRDTMRGLALMLNDKAVIADVFAALNYAGADIGAGHSLYEVARFDKKDEFETDESYVEQKVLALRDFMATEFERAIAASGIVDERHVARHVEIGLYYAHIDTGAGAEPVKTWFLYVKTHDVRGAMALAREAAETHMTASRFVEKQSAVVGNGAYLRNATATIVAAHFGASLKGRTVAAAAPWSSAVRMSIVKATVDNVWNTAVHIGKGAVAWYHYALAAQEARGGSLFLKTRASGITWLRGGKPDLSIADATLAPKALFAFPRGYPTKGRDRGARLLPGDVAEIDTDAIRDGRVLWPAGADAAQPLFHPKLAHAYYKRLDTKKGAFKRILVELGWTTDDAVHLYRAALFIGGFSRTEGDLSIREYLDLSERFTAKTVLDATDAGATDTAVPIEWHFFMGLFAKYRDKLGDGFPLASFPEPQPGKTLVVPRALLRNLLRWDDAASAKQ